MPIGGVVQIVRTDGRFAIVGIEIRHCRRAGPHEYRVGVQFGPLPDGFTREETLGTENEDDAHADILGKLSDECR